MNRTLRRFGVSANAATGKRKRPRPRRGRQRCMAILGESVGRRAGMYHDANAVARRNRCRRIITPHAATRSRGMPRLMAFVGLVLAASVQAATEPRAARTDSFGDPLPPGAVARLGTRRWRVSDAPTKHLAVSPNGKLVATTSDDGSIRILDVPSGRLMRAFHMRDEGDFSSHLVAFTSDSKGLVVGGGPQFVVQTIDIANGRIRPLLQMPRGVCTALSADGRWAIVWRTLRQRSGLISAFDLVRGKEIVLLEGPPFEGIDSFGMAISPDGRFAALTSPASDNRSRVVVCELSTGKRWVSPSIQESLTAITFAPDGRFFVTRGESSLQSWELTRSGGASPSFRLTG